ncbi:MAG TPA: PEP-CTERM sorting domain-containing protein [Phycisphaerae bacterium]|nr:PEP-CTERM sorting domain-containing protein [Phycisphaerae bacterium]
MRACNSIVMGCVISACMLGAAASSAMGANATAQMVVTGFDDNFGNLRVNGTTAVYGYSSQNQLENSTLTPVVIIGGTAQNVAAAQPAANMGGYYTGTLPGTGGQNPNAAGTWFDRSRGQNNPYRALPTISLQTANVGTTNGLSKGLLNKTTTPYDDTKTDQYTLTSTTLAFEGQGSSYVNSTGNKREYAMASGTVPAGGRGSAFGKSTDPLSISSGSSYIYNPTITGSAHSDANCDAGFDAEAGDSSVFSTYDPNAAGLDAPPLAETLWYLAAEANGGTSTKITFVLNPLALNEITFPSSFIASLPPFSNAAQEAALISQAVVNSLALQGTFSAGAMDFNNASLFPAGTTYQAISGGVQYVDASDAFVAGTEVPEPATGVMLMGFVGAAVVRRRR